MSTPLPAATDLASLADEVGAVAAGASSEVAERHRHLEVILRSYLAPRVETSPAPLVVVFAGPSGAGKSTLINGVTGSALATAGVIRPTTRHPVALGRSLGALDVGCDLVTGTAPILAEMTFIDTPDLDSTDTGHRTGAEALVDRSDVVVFVTSAFRYADKVPWELLRRVTGRGTPVVPVLNRVSAAASGAVSDFTRLLRRAGVSGDPVVVQEHHLTSERPLLPAGAVRRLRRRLLDLSGSRPLYGVMAWALSETEELVRLAEERADRAEHDLAVMAGRRRPDAERILARMGEVPVVRRRRDVKSLARLVAAAVKADLWSLGGDGKGVETAVTDWIRQSKLRRSGVDGAAVQALVTHLEPAYETVPLPQTVAPSRERLAQARRVLERIAAGQPALADA